MTPNSRAVFLICAACGPTYDDVKRHAEEEATAFAEETRLDVSGVSCSSRDSDHDGDVGCTLSLPDGTTKAIECNTPSWGLDAAVYGQPFGCKVVVYAALGVSQDGQRDD